MRISSPIDAVYALIARLPLLAIAALVVWVALAGLQQLELRSEGTTILVPAGESIPVNDLATKRDRTEQDLMDALSTNDPAEMQAALDRAAESGAT